MADTLALNEIHKELISDYLRFTKYQTPQRIKSIDYCFNTLMSCRIQNFEMYTADDVRTILTDLKDVVRGEVETELSDSIHTNVLLVQQLLAQAEEWHLTLTANINELENRDKIAAIKSFEEASMSSAPQKLNITVTQGQQMMPLADRNVAMALKAEIERLKNENEVLRSKIETFEAEASNVAEKENVDSCNTSNKAVASIHKLEMDLIAAKEEIIRLQEELLASSSNESLPRPEESSSGVELEAVQEAMQKLSEELVSSKISACEQAEKLKQDLEARENKLRQVQSNLLLAEKELDKKFQATAAYTNMKKILMQKNNQIKSLRKKVESLGGAVGDEEEEDTDGKAGFHV